MLDLEVIINPILVSYIAQGLLPYRSLGSGIKRALEDWPACVAPNGCSNRY